MTPEDKEFTSYEEVINDHSGAIFLQLRPDHIRYLKGSVASVVLAYILNILRVRLLVPRDRRALADDELWFECQSRDICSDLGMWDNKVRRCLKTLVEAGMIEQEHREGKVLWLRVKKEGLLQAEKQARNAKMASSRNAKMAFQKRQNGVSLYIDEQLKKEDPPPETGGRDTLLGDFPKSHESNGHSSKGKVTAAQPLAMQIAIRLRAIVVGIFHITNPWSKVKWAGEIAIAERRYGAERLEKVFDWYEQNADRQEELRLPRVKSAANFKNTFDWIEEKMKKTDWNEGAIGM